ncbi:MAG: lytic transglycosylase domain-containing protein [Nitrospirales bacterium]
MMIVIFSVTMWVLAGASVLADSGFEPWLLELKADARAQGIADALLEQAFQGVEPLPRVLELDRRQPESTMTFVEYQENIVSEDRVRRGRQLLAEHREVLQAVAAKYGVPARYLVALWGIETHYGRLTGSFGVVEALATLAYDGRRSDYFRQELLKALRILKEGHIAFPDMKGSWAGAMGQCQFMPSSFLRFAVDETGDGRKDIWNTQADVFGSSANYLAQSGWRKNERWGRRVLLPTGFDTRQATLTQTKSLRQWQRLGVRTFDGADLPDSHMQGAIVLPDGHGGPAFLVYDNYRVIMKWNRSTYFATSVGLLADALM